MGRGKRGKEKQLAKKHTLPKRMREKMSRQAEEKLAKEKKD